MTDKIQHKFGQYFTTNEILKETVFKFILNKPLKILEPSIGQGDLVDFIKNKIKKVKFDMYEIDTKIKFLKKKLCMEILCSKKLNKNTKQ